MSAATATDAAPPANGGKKKLIIIIAAAVLVVALGGVGAMLLLKKKPAEEDGDEEAAGAGKAPAKTATVKHDPKAPPTFVPLEPFTVNLADREAERYAQVGVTLEITDGKLADQIKVFMPAIRMGVLMTIADKTAKQLMDREGKLRLARDIQRETSRALGFEVPDEEAEEGEKGDKAEASPPKKGAAAKKKDKKKAAPPELPIRAVHFSNFIIQ